MTPLDPVSSDLAEETGLPYQDVHDALALLANAGWNHDRACDLVRSASGTSLYESAAGIARAAIRASSAGHW